MADTDPKAQHEAGAEPAARLARAETLIKDHMLMSAGVGLIPAPGFDILAGIGIQLALLKRMTNLYGVTFSENAARSIIMSLLGGVGTGALAGGLFMSAMKLVPGVGTILGIASMPVAISAVTYAVGKVFLAHLELGGTLATFEPAAHRGYFKDLLKRGREAAASMKMPSLSKEPAKS
jgi:uncharacterized protein (DUF697 family)